MYFNHEEQNLQLGVFNNSKWMSLYIHDNCHFLITNSYIELQVQFNKQYKTFHLKGLKLPMAMNFNQILSISSEPVSLVMFNSWNNYAYT
jgi:hypothetical protein